MKQNHSHSTAWLHEDSITVHPLITWRVSQSAVESLCSMTEITLELLQQLLKEDYPDVTIQHYEGAPGSKRGDNYTSMVYRVTLKGIRKLVTTHDGSETDTKEKSDVKEELLVSIEGNSSSDLHEKVERWEGSLIYKRLPESIVRREAFKSDELFRNEVAFYTKIWPELSRFQSKWNVKYPFKSIPKCYLARNDCVVLKDLKQYGFLMPDRRQGLTIEECYTVMTQLSRFHALSLAMKCHDPKAFFNLLNEENGITEVFFVEENVDYYRSYYNEAIQNALAMVEEELQNSPSKDHYLEKFKHFCSEDTFFKTMVDVVKPREPLALICHGDCWTNNFLFRYKNGDIAEMSIVDYQLVRYASPALDLVYVLYLCLDRAQRSQHQESLLDLYVDELHASLLQMSEPGSVFYGSLEKDQLRNLVLEEFKCCSHFGLGISLDMYPIMNCDSDEAPNLYQSEDQDTSVVEHATQPVWTTNAACRRKMTDLVEELVDAGLL